jgi:hypothetical protein
MRRVGRAVFPTVIVVIRLVEIVGFPAFQGRYSRVAGSGTILLWVD